MVVPVVHADFHHFVLVGSFSFGFARTTDRETGIEGDSPSSRVRNRIAWCVFAACSGPCSSRPGMQRLPLPEPFCLSLQTHAPNVRRLLPPGGGVLLACRDCCLAGVLQTLRIQPLAAASRGCDITFHLKFNPALSVDVLWFCMIGWQHTSAEFC